MGRAGAAGAWGILGCWWDAYGRGGRHGVWRALGRVEGAVGGVQCLQQRWVGHWFVLPQVVQEGLFLGGEGGGGAGSVGLAA